MNKILTSLLTLPVLAGGLVGCSSDRIVRGPNQFSDFGNGPTDEVTVNCTNPGFYDEYGDDGWLYLSEVVNDPKNGGKVGVAIFEATIEQVCEDPNSRPASDPASGNNKPQVTQKPQPQIEFDYESFSTPNPDPSTWSSVN